MKISPFKKLTLDCTFVIALILYAVMHIYSWSSYPPDVDPINFTMALNHYDVSTDRPHPPGYPLYVGLARIASHIVSSQHAYQLVNLIMLLLSAISLYLVATRKNYPKVGFTSALLLLSHPLTLAATVVAETYFSDAFFGCLIASWILINSQNFRNQVIGISTIFLALGLFRAVSCLELMLLALACIYVTSTENYLKNIFISATCIVASIIIAYLLTIWLAGGFAIYSVAVARVMGDAFSSVSVFAGASIRAHALMIVKLTFWLLFVSLPTLLAVGYITRKYKIKTFLDIEAKKNLIICACWMLPPLALYTFFFFLKPTYLLILMPPIFLIFTIGLFLIFKAPRQLHAWVCIFLVIFFQLAIFYGGGKSLPTPIYRITHSYIKQQDAAWVELISVAQENSDEKALFVWIKHPSLSIYATRLIPWAGKFALLETRRENDLSQKNSSSEIKFFDPINMQWSAEKDNYIDINSFNLILVLNAHENLTSYKTYPADKFIDEFNILSRRRINEHNAW